MYILYCLRRSKDQTKPYALRRISFHGKFNGQEVLALFPTPKLDKHPLSAVREYLFNAATFHN
jgi:hypothetical protein